MVEGRCFLIAEVGVNHNGDVSLAHRLIDAAAEAGADAVKFQTFTAHELVTVDAPKAAYQMRNDGYGTQLDMLRALELSPAAHRELQARAAARGIMFLSTPFDEASADFLASLDVPLFKLSSGDLTNLPLISHVAKKGRPMLVSTGMADLEEVRSALTTIYDTGNRSVVMLHCVSSYPADPGDVNLLAMRTMRESLRVAVGYSDHTVGIDVALAAVALGACVLEKHLTLDRHLPGPDHAASLEPDEWRLLVAGARTIEKALGDGVKRPTPAEADAARVARRSLVAARDLPAGMILSPDAIAIRRPGTGLPPRMRAELVGRALQVPVEAGALLTLEMLA